MIQNNFFKKLDDDDIKYQSIEYDANLKAKKNKEFKIIKDINSLLDEIKEEEVKVKESFE